MARTPATDIVEDPTNLSVPSLDLGLNTGRVVIEIEPLANLPIELRPKIEMARKRVQAIVDELAPRGTVPPPSSGEPRFDNASPLDRAYAAMIVLYRQEREKIDKHIQTVDREQPPRVAEIAKQLADNNKQAVETIGVAVATFKAQLRAISLKADLARNESSSAEATVTTEVTTAIEDLLKAVVEAANWALRQAERLAREVDKITAEVAVVPPRRRVTPPPEAGEPGSEAAVPGTKTVTGGEETVTGGGKRYYERLLQGKDSGGEDSESEDSEGGDSQQAASIAKLSELVDRVLRSQQDELSRNVNPTQTAAAAAPQRNSWVDTLLQMLPILAMTGAMTGAQMLPQLIAAGSFAQQQEQARQDDEDDEYDEEGEDESPESSELASADAPPGGVQPPSQPGAPPGDQPTDAVTANLGGTLVTAESPEVKAILEDVFTGQNPEAAKAYAENSQRIDPAQLESTGDVAEFEKKGPVPVVMQPDGPKIVMHNELRAASDPPAEYGNFLGYGRPEPVQVAAARPQPVA